MGTGVRNVKFGLSGSRVLGLESKEVETGWCGGFCDGVNVFKATKLCT